MGFSGLGCGGLGCREMESRRGWWRTGFEGCTGGSTRLIRVFGHRKQCCSRAHLSLCTSAIFSLLCKCHLLQQCCSLRLASVACRPCRPTKPIAVYTSARRSAPLHTIIYYKKSNTALLSPSCPFPKTAPASIQYWPQARSGLTRAIYYETADISTKACAATLQVHDCKAPGLLAQPSPSATPVWPTSRQVDRIDSIRGSDSALAVIDVQSTGSYISGALEPVTYISGALEPVIF